MKKPKLVTVREYCQLTGITPQAVHNRVKALTLAYAMTEPVNMIDLNIYPAKKLTLGKRPYKTN